MKPPNVEVVRSSGVIASVAALLFACTPPIRATYDMTWRYEEDGTCRTMRHVVLTFVEYPAYQVGYCSDELAAYLDSLPDRPISVVFEVWRPEAQLGGGDPVQVGTLTHWKWEFSHMGRYQDTLTTVPPRHPWEPLRAKPSTTPAGG